MSSKAFPHPPAILIVDDDDAFAALVASQVKRLHWETHLVAHGEAAWEYLRTYPVDLVVLDWMMPQLDGILLLERMRAHPRLEEIPVLMVTALGHETANVLEALEKGANDCLGKPFSFAEFRARAFTLLKMKFLADDVRRDKMKLEEDLLFAQRVQKTLLGHVSGVPPHMELASRYLPSRYLSGDLYDFLALGGGHYGMFMGDVTGQGAPAALFTALVKFLVRQEATASRDPAEVLGALHAKLFEMLEQGTFISCCYALIAPAERTLWFSGAGHGKQLLLHRESGACEDLTSGGPLLGLFPEAAFATSSHSLGAGDRLLLFTDGLPDSTGLSEAAFLDQLRPLLKRTVDLDASGAVEAIVRGIIGEPHEQLGDDMLLALLEIKGEGDAGR